MTDDVMAVRRTLLAAIARPVAKCKWCQKPTKQTFCSRACYEEFHCEDGRDD